jgi:hypothetical protein
MQFDQNGFPMRMDEQDDATLGLNGGSSDATVQAALASLSTQGNGPKQPRPGEVKWRLTTLIFPAILLLFVALYVTSLSAGVEPEVALFRAGGASVVLAVLGRVAVGILGDDTRLVLNDNQIVAMARTGAVRDYLSGAGAERDSDGANQPSKAAQAAGAGGKE